MTRAVLKNGQICPLDALPPEWPEGQELRVEACPPDDEESVDLDEWYRELNELVSTTDPKEWERVEQTLKFAHAQAKEHARKQMGLP